VSFHPCVLHDKWFRERVISFLPPDGRFKLFTYWITGWPELPIYIKPEITSASSNAIEVKITTGTKNLQGSQVERVAITLKFSKYINSAHMSTEVGMGSIFYDEMQKICVWTIGTVTTNTPVLNGKITAPSGMKETKDKHYISSITAEFCVRKHAASGIAVENLNSNLPQKIYKGVQYTTKGGLVEIRV